MGDYMRIGIVYNEKNENCREYVLRLQDYCVQQGVEVKAVNRDFNDPHMFAGSDFILSVGGDGTFLKAAKATFDSGIPILGFNLGTFGLLAEYNADDMQEVISRLINKNYFTEQRSMLNFNMYDNTTNEHIGHAHALNDIVIVRQAPLGVAYLDVFINDNYVETYPCDGVIVSTPTGSTAYSLSAGGPIVDPGAEVMLLTPICAHYTQSAGIVLNPKGTVTIRNAREQNKVVALMDGDKSIEIPENARIECTLNEKKIEVVRLHPTNFYRALKNKGTRRKERIQHEE